MAVLAVVLYHAGLLPGGFVGVDVFFVISGFVIGRVLLAEYAVRGNISLWRFYARRIRRLLPALALMLTVVVLLAPWLSPSTSILVTLHTAIATMLLGANFYLFRATGYFAPAAHLNPLLHTWSLSVEEQFYLVIPPLLALTLLATGKQSPVARVTVLIAELAAISFALSVALSAPGLAQAPGFAFYGAQSRAWEFLAGFALVLLPDHRLPLGQSRVLLSVLGMAGLSYSFARISDRMAFPGWIALLPVLSTSILIVSRSLGPGPRTQRVRWALLRPVERLGDLSYSWYLWHWPIIVFATAYWAHTTWVPGLAGALSLVPAWISYWYVENPIRNRSARFRAAPIGIALTCLVLVITASQFSQRVITPDVAYVTKAPYRLHADASRGCDSWTPLGSRASSNCTWGDTKSPDHIVLVGDSNAGQFSEALIGAGQKLGASVTIATRSSCLFVELPATDHTSLPGTATTNAECHHFVDGTLSYLTRHPARVVVIGMTATYLNALDKATFVRGLTRVTAQLQRSGSHVAFLAVVPKPEDAGITYTPAACSSLALKQHPDSCLFPPFAKPPGLRVAMNDDLQVVADHTGATVWRYGDLVCPSTVCVPIEDRVPVWRNRGHLSAPFAQLLVGRTVQYLQPLTQPDNQATSSTQH